MRTLTGSVLHPLRLAAARGKRCLLDAWRGETAETFFDDHDPRVLNALLAEAGVAPLAFDPSEADRDPAGAARFVCACRQHFPDVRRRFPRGLSDGEDGPFALWLLAEGRERFGLSSVAAT